MSIRILTAKEVQHTMYPDFHANKDRAGKHTEDCLGCAYDSLRLHVYTLEEDLRFYKHEWENACHRANGSFEDVKSLRAELEEMKKQCATK